jgi:glycyl-tRNA synthetase
MNVDKSVVTLEKIVSLCKRRGLIFQSADIYGGLNGVYDFGPLGTSLKKNIRKSWEQAIKKFSKNIIFMEGSLLGSEDVWRASGHISNFHDPMVDCLNCKHRFRADEIDLTKSCASCGVKNWTEPREFNLMFKTQMGALADSTSNAYLRPETAQSIFINFKNIISTYRVKIPFGIAQIGKSFRNEITPRQFLFRTREFEQMEIEWFCKPEESLAVFEQWLKARQDYYYNLGFNEHDIRFKAHAKEDLSHYSVCCTDVEYLFPFGWKELEGIAHRGDFDLSTHSKHSGKNLEVYEEENKKSYTPHVVECSVGTDRLMLALLCRAYREDEVEGETRIYLDLKPAIAPVTVAILPLTKKLSENAAPIFKELEDHDIAVEFDDAGSVGKRYRRQDEIGTPLCVTFDFESLEDNCVTVRDRNSTKQERIAIKDIAKYVKNILKQ